MTGRAAKIRIEILASVLAHSAVLAALFLAASHAPVVAPFRMPGTAKGVHLLTYYSPGSSAPVRADGPLLPVPKPALAKMAISASPVAAPAELPSRSEHGVGATAVSGVGDGDITMAFQKVFPPPRPDLSTIAPGHHGEVVLNAVIDAEGKIQKLTLLKSATPAIDEVVIATVQTWVYKPATRNGSPVASEQELHFYYERG